jgi:hypothetical protein
MPSLLLVKIAKNVLNEKQLFPGNIASKFQQFLLFTKYIVFLYFFLLFFSGFLLKLRRSLIWLEKQTRKEKS